MVGLNLLLFGYRIITPEDSFLPRLASHLIHLGIPATAVGDGFAIRESDFPRFFAYAKGRIRYTATDTLGLFGVIKKRKRDFPVFIAFILSLVAIVLLSGLVWDVRVISSEEADEDRIVSTLRDLGFGEGTPWSTFEKERVEALLLDTLDDIAWVSINRDGVVAMVEVRTVSETGDVPDIPPTASNIIAAYDGVVEEILVESGTALVRAGDVVEKGDILISGVIETEYGTVLTAAKGVVVAHRIEDIAVEVPRERTTTEYHTTRVSAISVTILGLNINIFKNYGNLPTECDIIEEKVRLTLPSGIRLPLSITTAYVAEPVSSTEIYSDSELPVLARDAIFNELSGRRGDGDLIKITTNGEYTDTGYRITLRAVIAADIGEVREIKIN